MKKNGQKPKTATTTTTTTTTKQIWLEVQFLVIILLILCVAMAGPRNSHKFGHDFSWPCLEERMKCLKWNNFDQGHRTSKKYKNTRVSLASQHRIRSTTERRSRKNACLRSDISYFLCCTRKRDLFG